MTETAIIVGITRVACASLVAAVWQGISLVLIAGVGLRLLPKSPAAVRFAIWFAVFLALIALPGFALISHPATAAARSGHNAWLTLDPRWSLWIAAVWAMTSLIRMTTLLVAAVRVRQLWKRAVPVADWATGLVAEGASGRAQLCVSDEVDRPTVIGFLSPKIVLPEWLLAKLTAVELEQIVLHEAGHLRRRDDWMNLLQKIALVVFPLNPALLWVERRLCFEREMACDEQVLRKTQAPKAYATCLATVAEYRLGRRGLALALGALGRESELGQRIRRILRRDESMQPAQARFVMGAAMLALVFGAVELARCPHIVAFSDAAAQTRVAEAVIRPVPLPARYQYEPVVFHPPIVRAHTKPPQLSVVQKAAARTLPKPRPAHWVEVTAWESADGSRVILTTEHRSAPTGRAMFVPVSAVPDQDFSQPVHPYAAVAVPDGWLVFQL